MQREQMATPIGNKTPDSSVIKEAHYRFIGAAYAMGYRATETEKLLNREFGVELSYHTIRSYYTILDELGLTVYSFFKGGEAISPESTQKVLAVVAPNRKKLLGLFDEYCINYRKIKEDPTFGIPYADKRKRVLKLSKNIEELDTPEVIAKGSYPVSSTKDGGMVFETFTIEKKNYTEQRRTIESIGGLVDGLSAGDVVINIVSGERDEIPLTEAVEEAKVVDDNKLTE